MAALRPIVIAGPSGVGKSTLIKRLMAEHPEKFGFSVSHTTRQPRPSEQHGLHYHFVDRQKMQELIDAHSFVEHAEYSGNMYGTSKDALQVLFSQGKVPLLDIDMQGVLQVSESDLSALFIFIRPPSIEELERRLRGRGDTAEEAMQKRLKQAAWELETAARPGLFNHVIVNESLDSASQQLNSICAGHAEAVFAKK